MTPVGADADAHDPQPNAVASSSRSAMTPSPSPPQQRRTRDPERLTKPAPIPPPSSLARIPSLPRLSYVLPQCDPALSGGSSHSNPLCSTSNQALVLALVLVGTSYLVQRRYARWAATRKERLAEVRRRELVSALEQEKGRERAGLEDGEGEAGHGEARGGRRKRRGTNGGVNGLLHPESSVERSSAGGGSSTPATSVSPARGRTSSSASTSGIKSPASKTVSLPRTRAIETISELDASDFTLVTPHKAKGKHGAVASSSATPNGLSLVIHEHGAQSGAHDASTAVTPTASFKRKKNKKKSDKDATSDDPAASITSSDVGAEDTIGRAASRLNSGPSDSSASSSTRPDWLMSPLGTDRELSRSTSISSGAFGTAPLDVLGLDTASDAFANDEIDRMRGAHAAEIARIRKEAREREHEAVEAARADTMRTQQALDQERARLADLRAQLDEARIINDRRDSALVDETTKPSGPPNDQATAQSNGHIEPPQDKDDGMKQLKQETIRLAAELQRRASATITSPVRTRDQLHHGEFARLREEINKAQRAANHWRNRAENGERVLVQMQAGETDFQRKMAEQSTAFQQLAAQYAQARHIIQQYEMAMLDRRASAPVSPMGMCGANGHPNGFLGVQLAAPPGSAETSHPSTPSINGHHQSHSMLLSPNGMSFASPTIPAGWFDNTRAFPSQLGPGTPSSHANGMVLGPSDGQGFVGTPLTGQPALFNTVAWSVLKNRGDSLPSSVSAPSGDSGDQAPTGGSTNDSEERSEPPADPTAGPEECSPRSLPATEKVPPQTPQALSLPVPSVPPSSLPNPGGLSPRRILGDQLIDMAAAATERRASCSSSHASAGEPSPQFAPAGLLPSLLKANEALIEPDHPADIGQAHKQDLDLDLSAQSPTSESEADAQIPVIFASVHHGPSELEAIEAMQTEHAERARERRRSRSAE